MTVIVDVAGVVLDQLLERLALGDVAALDRVPAAAFGLNLTGEAFRDTTVAASFLLARTRSSRFIVRAQPALQHPVNLARNLSTLNALHPGRIGLAVSADADTRAWFLPEGGASAADYLRLVSSLWDSWPLDAIIGDTAGGRYVDDQRIVRVADPVYGSIGGPLTLPTDTSDKPPLLLLGGLADDAALDLVVGRDGLTSPGTLEELLALGQGLAPEPVSLRTVLGLPSSRVVAVQVQQVFNDRGVAGKV